MKRREFISRGAATVGGASLVGVVAGSTPSYAGVVSTRGHFEPSIDGANLTDGHTTLDYDAEDLPGFPSGDRPDEVVVFAHGYYIDRAAAETRFEETTAALRAVGSEVPVVGFTWDAVQNYLPAAFAVAERNGPKLASFLADYARTTGATVRLMGQSLGARICVEAVDALDGWGKRDLLDSVTLLGAAVEDDTASKTGEYGPALGRAAGTVDNFWKDDDMVLGIAYRLWAMNGVLGADGVDGTPPANYEDHEVPDVPDHRSYSEPGEGCMDRVVEQF